MNTECGLKRQQNTSSHLPIPPDSEMLKSHVAKGKEAATQELKRLGIQGLRSVFHRAQVRR